MNIFESLENLNVSEECFRGIIELVEELLSEEIVDSIEKLKDPEKQCRLYDKIHGIQRKEMKQAAKREGKTEDEIFHKRFRDKNKLGAKKHFERYAEDPLDYDDGDYGMQFVPIQKQHSKDDYEAHVAKHGVT